MSNNFPNDITIDILLMLPEKSLLRFKSVCKTWRSLIEDFQFAKLHYYLNKILQALENDRRFSLDTPLIEPPSQISISLSKRFLNSCTSGLFLLAFPLSDKVIFWNPDLSESTTIRLPFPTTSLITLGECLYLAKYNMMVELEVQKKNGTSNSWTKMLAITESEFGPVFLKKGGKKNGGGDMLYFRRDKNEYVVYDSKTQKFNEVKVAGFEARRKLKLEFKITGPEALLFIDRTYVKTLISPDALQN
ncbi:putative F-box protein At3g21120 [Nicotiana tabacum]|uniref:F-box protein At3g21120 n=1 Tax=Nicotiana tabacum TaxID=4097 RepID=A0A1S3ZG88_TOBAC|nr:putative F-box protein At3g21120 [Nicotiana tomentosiformis]XP_016463463.1 PREDICTED: putative F-box protein At3g21120 [Nicotiana tabacum]